MAKISNSNERDSDTIEGEVVENTSEEQVSSDVLHDDLENLEEDSGRRAFSWENLRNVLREAGISRRQFFMLSGCAVVFLISLSIFVYFLFQIVDRSTEEETPATEPKVEEGPRPRKSEDAQVSENWLKTAVELGSLFTPLGKDFERGLMAGISLGNPVFQFSRDSTVARSIELLQRLNALLEINVTVILDESLNREETLQNYLQELKKIEPTTEEVRVILIDEINGLKSEFETVSGEKNREEDVFFGNVNSLLARESENALESFVELVEKQSAVKAQFNARTKIKSLLDPRIVRLKARIQGIELNYEALVKGIKVIRVENSGIDLIETVEKK